MRGGKEGGQEASKPEDPREMSRPRGLRARGEAGGVQGVKPRGRYGGLEAQREARVQPRHPEACRCRGRPGARHRDFERSIGFEFKKLSILILRGRHIHLGTYMLVKRP